jgi:hypothetical protein
MAVIPEIHVFSFVTGTCHSPAVPLYEVRKQYMYLHQIRVAWSIIETTVEKPFVAKKGPFDNLQTVRRPQTSV